MASGRTPGSSTPGSTVADADAAADSAAAKAKAVQDQRAAEQKLNDIEHLSAAENYKLEHFWKYWKFVSETAEIDPNGPRLSSAPGSFSPLKPGKYLLIGSQPPIYANFSYDSKTQTHSVQIEIRDKSFGKDIKAEPKTEAGWDAHAETVGKELARFCANAGFKSMKMTIPEEHEFIRSGYGNLGPGTLIYLTKCAEAAVLEACRCGIPFDSSDPMFQKFLTAYADKDGDACRKLIDRISESQASGKLHKEISNFASSKILTEQAAILEKACGGLPENWNSDAKDEINKAIIAQKQKVDNLSADMTKAEGELIALENERLDLDKKIKALPAGMTDADLGRNMAKLDKAITEKGEQINEIERQRDDVHAPRLNELVNLQKDLEAALDEPNKINNNADLQKVMSKLEEAKNPEQKFIEAKDELRKAFDSIDQAKVTDPAQKTQLDGIEAKLKELEAKLEKGLSKVEQTQVEKDITNLTKQMKALSDKNPEVKDKTEAAVKQAEALAAGEKPSMDAAKNFEDRLAALEKAAATLESMMNEYRNFDYAKLAGDPAKGQKGMIIERKAWYQVGELKRLEAPEQAKEYVDQRFDKTKPGREGLATDIEAERNSLAEIAKNMSATEKVNAESRLKAVEKKVAQFRADQAAIDAERADASAVRRAKK